MLLCARSGEEAAPDSHAQVERDGTTLCTARGPALLRIEMILTFRTHHELARAGHANSFRV